MPEQHFVPEDFVVPRSLSVGPLRLEPLGPGHNVGDHAAWTSSIRHIKATPGFRRRPWPPAGGMTLDRNLADLQRHAEDFVRRVGFTYTVIDPSVDEIVGCVYVYPSPRAEFDAQVRSWVREDRAELDDVLHEAVCRWLSVKWPFSTVDYRPSSDDAVTGSSESSG